MDEESRTLQNSAGEEQRSECADQGREFRFARNEADEHENSRDSFGTFASSWSEHTHTHTPQILTSKIRGS
jgi:E3 ubiquitin-protein ligase ATL7/58/59